VSTFLFVEISSVFLVGGVAGAGLACAGYRRIEARDANLDRFRTAAVRRQWDRVLRTLPRATDVQFKIGKILGEQGECEGPKLTHAQIHEIGVQGVEKALGPQADELRSWAERVVADLPYNEHRLAYVG
jgi:hypothetical protein